MNFLVIRPADIWLFQQFFGNSAKDANWYTCSLESFGLLLNNKFDNVHCISGPCEMYIDEQRLELDFDVLARDLDYLCSNIRRQSGVISGESRGWDYLYFYFLLNCYARYEVMSRMLAALLPQAQTYHVLIPDVSPDYHLDSFCFRSVLLMNLTSLDVKIVKFGNATLAAREAVYETSYSLDSLPKDSRVVISVPTMYHPRPQDRQLIARAAENCIDFPSPLFDVPVSARRALLGKDIEVDDKHLENYKTLLDRHLLPVLEQACPKFTARSYKRVCNRATFEVRFYKLLRESSRLESVEQLVVTNHDGGIQGPLLTWASEKKIEVILLPHSSLDNIPLPKLNTETRFDVISNSQPSNLNRIDDFSLMGRLYYSQDASGASSRFEHFVSSNRESGIRLLLVHNELDDYAYFPAENTKDYTQAVALFVAAAGVCELRHRFKPNKFSRCLFQECLSIDDKHEAIEWANLVVGLGQPSSFLVECESVGKFTAHVCSRPLGHKSRQLLHKSTFIICRGSLLEGAESIINAIRSSVVP